jgi:hypothetical protein
MSRGRESRQHGGHGETYAAEDVGLEAVLEQLEVSRDGLAQVAELTDTQLDVSPPAGSFRFCDGKRNLEQVLAGLLKHQRRQIDVLTAAV